MKKILLITSLITASCLYAQDEGAQYQEDQDFNKWSVELAGGMHKPSRPFADAYSADTPSFGQGSFGVRYMFNTRFGLKLDLGFNSIEDKSDSAPFKSHYYRSTLQGVVNLGNVLHFQTWTKSIGLLFHGGVGYSQLRPQEPLKRSSADQMLNVMGGISPQIKLGNRVALKGDVSVIGNIRQHYTWDGTEINEIRGFDGDMFNFSLGLNVYLGKHGVHADWAPEVYGSDGSMSDLEARLSKIETDMIDSDQDGVPDYLDREPNTPSGVAVNTKGIAVDTNNNGIPDEMESALDARFTKKGEISKETGSSMIKKLIDEGYVNVYFQFNSSKPETYSLEAINYLIKYMADHPSAKAELIGYADEIGGVEYNQTLSANRAKAVSDILVATGVSVDRITHRGAGQNTSVDKNSAPARQLVRCVTFRLVD